MPGLPRPDAEGHTEMDVFPDFGAAAELQNIVGAMLTFVLIISVVMMIISGVT